MGKLFKNLKFRSKIICIFGVMFFLSTVVSGFMYYGYTSHNIDISFQVGAEDVIIQIADTLDMRLSAIRQRTQGMLANYTFAIDLANFLNNPNEENDAKAMGTVSSFLTDLETGESLIHSTYIYTDKREFDNFARMRNWDFDFINSEYFQRYQEEGKATRWFPVREDEIFVDDDEIIPYIRKFSVIGYKGDQYLIIQLKKAEFNRLLSGKYEFFDKLLISDEKGNLIAGSEGFNVEELMELASSDDIIGNVIASDYTYEGETYLVVNAALTENNWQVFGLKSKKTLLGSLSELRMVIFEIMGVIFLLGTAGILFLSHQLTDSLRRLEKRMSFVEKGDFNVRFFYPYKDEVGSLAKGFNYMVGEIQNLVEKQDETIRELKQERDHVAEVYKQKRKAELNALQAQINPHFLYNTLNAITWQAQDFGANEISILSSSLGRFFRVSLSKGAEIITLREELEHVKSYLEIQSIRYHERLNYEIDVSPEYLDCRVIKLIVQPLAENSIYHGIKEKQGTGCIKISVISAFRNEEKIIQLSVWDDGVGISKDKLLVINEALEKGETSSSGGYGIFNVNERVKLFYGKQYGLSYESEEGQWTKAVLTLPEKFLEVE